MNIIHVNFSGRPVAGVQQSLTWHDTLTTVCADRLPEGVSAAEEVAQLLEGKGDADAAVVVTAPGTAAAKALFFTRALRRKKLRPLVLFLGTPSGRIHKDALAAGAQLFLPVTKNASRQYAVDSDLLRAQILAVEGFAKGQHGTVFRFCGFELNRNTYDFKLLGRALCGLKPTDRKVLAELVLAKGQLLSRETLLARLYPAGAKASETAINVYMSQIRRAIKSHLREMGCPEPGTEQPIIEYETGRGYRLCAKTFGELAAAQP